MDIYVQEAYRKLGLDVGAKRKRVERVYKQLKAKHLAEKLSFDEWYEANMSYTMIINYLNEIEEYKNREKEIQKRILLIETDKMQRKMAAIKEEEDRKGPLWVLLEGLSVEEIKNTNIDFWQYIEEKVLSVMPSNKASKYKKFLNRFKKMWEEMYPRICKFEYDLLVDGDLTSSCEWSVGMDELTKSRFSMGRYKDVFNMGYELSSLIPDSDPFYIIDRHFSLIAEFVGLEYSVTTFGNCPIYAFNPGTRLKKYREEYLKQFGEEVRSGVRTSPYVDNNELLNYVTKALRPYNSYVKNKTS